MIYNDTKRKPSKHSSIIISIIIHELANIIIWAKHMIKQGYNNE